MTNKTHIPRIDESVEERAAQLLGADPTSPIDEQTWLEGTYKALKFQSGGSTSVLGIPILDSDPSPLQDGFVWINRTVNKLRWRWLSTTREIDLSQGEDNGFEKNTGWYLDTIQAAELSEISDTQEDLKTSLLESFNGEVKEHVEYLGAQLDASKFTVDKDFAEAIYKREMRTHIRANIAEGAIVANIQSVFPKEITDNTDGTHTIAFHGDVTDLFKVDLAVYAYEIGYEEGKLRHFFNLNANNNPNKFIVDSVGLYDINTNTTEVTIQDNDEDLTLGLIQADWKEKLRFLPFNMKVEASGEGKDGVMAELELVEARATEATRIIGEDNYHILQSAFPGSINYVIAKQSESKQYTIILAAQTDSKGVVGSNPFVRNSNTYVRMWYSTDYMQTIQYLDHTMPMFSPGTNNTNNDHPGDFGMHAAAHILNPTALNINDDGKFVLGYSSWYSAGNTYWRSRVEWGDIGVPEPWAANFNKSDVLGSNSDEEFWYSGTYNTLMEHLAVDFDSMVNDKAVAVAQMGISVGSNSSDMINVYMEFDWATRTTKYPGYSNFGDQYFLYNLRIGIWEDFRAYNGSPDTGGFNRFMYGRKYLTFHRHDGNDYTYCYSVSKGFINNLMANYTGWGYAGNTGGFGASFHNSPFGGNSSNYAGALHFMTSSAAGPLNYYHDKVNRRLYWTQYHGSIPGMGMLDFSRTTDGRKHIEQFTPDRTPDMGKFRLHMYTKYDSGSSWTDLYSGVDVGTVNANTFLNHTADATDLTNYMDAVYNASTTNNWQITGDLATGFTLEAGPENADVQSGAERHREYFFPIDKRFYYKRNNGIDSYQYHGDPAPMRATHTLRSSADPIEYIKQQSFYGIQGLNNGIGVYIPAENRRRIIEGFTVGAKFVGTGWVRPEMTLSPVTTEPLTPEESKELFNLATNGTLSTYGQGPTTWDSIWNPSLLNNHNYSDFAARTGGSTSNHNGIGVTFNFNRDVALKRFETWGYLSSSAFTGDYNVDYWDGAAWQTIATFSHPITEIGPDGQHIMVFNNPDTIDIQYKDGPAISGSYDLVFQGEATTIDFTDTVGDIQTALNTNTKIIAAGGVTVTGTLDNYTVQFTVINNVDQISVQNNTLLFGGVDTLQGIFYSNPANQLAYWNGTSEVTPLAGLINPQYMIEANNRLYFRASDGVNTKLYEWDFVSATATAVIDEIEGDPSYAPGQIFTHDNKLYFGATAGSNSGLYVWDFVSESVTKLGSVGGQGSYTFRDPVVASNGKVYFYAPDTVSIGGRLYEWDFASSSATLVFADITGNQFYGNGAVIAGEHAGKLIFSAVNGRLWEWDFVSAAPTLLLDSTLDPNHPAVDGNGITNRSAIIAYGKIYFSGRLLATPLEKRLYSWDFVPTNSPIEIFASINGEVNYTPEELSHDTINDILYFRIGNDPLSGTLRSLASWDFSAASPTVLTDLESSNSFTNVAITGIRPLNLIKNQDSPVKSNQWRWYTTNGFNDTVSASNFYIFEAHAYEKITNYPTETLTTFNYAPGSPQTHSEIIGRYFGPAYPDSGSTGVQRDFTVDFDLPNTASDGYKSGNLGADIDGLVLLPNIAYVAHLSFPNSSGTMYLTEDQGATAQYDFYDQYNYSAGGLALEPFRSSRVPAHFEIRFREGVSFNKNVILSGQIARGLYLNNSVHAYNEDAIGPDGNVENEIDWINTFSRPYAYCSFYKYFGGQSHGAATYYRMDAGDEVYRSFAQTYDQELQFRDKTMLATYTWEETNSGADHITAHFIKQPHIDRWIGDVYDTFQGYTNNAITYISGPVSYRGSSYTNAVYQKIIIGDEFTDLVYSSRNHMPVNEQIYFEHNGIPYRKKIAAQLKNDLVPLRTFSFYAYKTWNGNVIAGDPDHEFILRIYVPDGSNPNFPLLGIPIAESSNTLKIRDFSPSGESKWVHFVVDDFWANFGQELFIAIEPVNHDPRDNHKNHPKVALADTDDGLMMPAFQSTTTNPLKAVRLNDEGELELMSTSLHMRIEDTYWVNTPIIAEQDNRMLYGIWNTNTGGVKAEHREHYIIPKSAGSDQYYVTYSQHDYSDKGNNRQEDYNGQTTYQLELDDSQGQYKLPTFSKPKVVGHNDTTTHDPDARFMWAPIPESRHLHDDKRHRSLEDAVEATIEQNGYRGLGGSELSGSWDLNLWDTNLTKHASLFGNDPEEAPLWIPNPLSGGTTPNNPTDVGQGVYRHNGFTHGYGTKFSDNNTGFGWTNDSYNLQPQNFDFYYEVEWEMTNWDWQRAGTYETPIGNVDPDNLPGFAGTYYHIMPFSIHNFMYLGMHRGRYHIWLRNQYNNASQAESFQTEEMVPLNIPHIVRWYRRNSTGGFGIKRSFDKGETWEELSVATKDPNQQEPNSIQYTSFSFPTSTYATYTDQIRVGRYGPDNNHDVRGLIGYVKVGIGSADPTYHGVRSQRACRQYRLIENKLVGIREAIGAGSNVDGFQNIYGEAFIVDLRNLTSKVETSEQIFKFRGTIAEGSRMGLKVTLNGDENKRESSSIQGLLFNYIRDNIQ